jgi:hypothetical protein
MQIDRSQTDSASLAAIGIDAARLLVAGDFHALAERFGYARAMGRHCADSVRADLPGCLPLWNA